MPHYIDANFDSPLDLFRSPRAAAQLVRLGAFRKLGDAVRSFFHDPRLVKLFSFQAMYAGLAPEKALAIYAVITYMDSIEGVYFPEGGMHAVPQALASAAEKNGAEMRYDATVESVLRSPSGRVAGVRLSGGETLRADAVVCTLDTPVAYEQLLPDLRPPRAARPGKGDYSPSAVVWHVGVRGMPPAEAAHHNIHFGEQWDESFDALLERGTLMPDPSRLVSVHSLDAPDQAPEGCSSLYVLEPVPNLATGRIDWKQEGPRMRDRLHGFLGENGYPDDVVVEELLTPVEWQEQGMAAGTPFALAHTFAQTGPFRPPNVEKRLPGMFFAGSGTVPGVGVPMVLISGKLAAEAGGRLPPDAGAMTSPTEVTGAGRAGPASPFPLAEPVDGSAEAVKLRRRLPGVRAPHPAARHDVLLGRRAAAEGAASARVRGVRAVPAGRRHRRLTQDEGPTRLPATRAVEGYPETAARLEAFADVVPRRARRRRQRRPGAGRDRAQRAALRHRPGVLRPVLRGHGDGPDHHLVRDVGGPAAATWRARPRSSAR